MDRAFDRRVVPERVLDLVKACQKKAPAHLGGGAALSGAYLGHRLSETELRDFRDELRERLRNIAVPQQR